ncbi:cysteine desulfurase family protein [Azospirillum isscasi]|uniref:cysteine desulfurase family protein n=1 Tax=Azospirillum isscasi TaxID=3053926 RepID=UPI0038992861
MLPFMADQFFQPSGDHLACREVSQAVERVRTCVKALVGVSDGDVIFTASATEANNLAIRGPAWQTLVVAPIEHPSVLRPAQQRQLEGANLHILPIDKFGVIDLEDLEQALSRMPPAMVSVQHGNQIIHTIQPLSEISAICRRHGAFLHVDATQTSGRVPISASAWAADFVTVSSHKCYGPKGVAALWLSPRAQQLAWHPQILGGGQERGLRAGSLNVPAIVGFGRACDLAVERLEADAQYLRCLGTDFWARLEKSGLDFTPNGPAQNRLPGGVHVSIRGADTRTLLARIPRVIASTGMACTQAGVDPVLTAIGRPSEASRGALRIQAGRGTTGDDIAEAADLITSTAKELSARWGSI